MHFSYALSYSGHNLHADPDISGLKLDIHSLAQKINARVTNLLNVRDATEKDNVLQDVL